MKVNEIGPAVPPCHRLPLKCLSPGVLFSLPTAPFSLYVKLPNGSVYNVPSFTEVYGYERNLDGDVIPHPEAVLTVNTGVYDPTNAANGYYKAGTEPKPCKL